MRTLSTQNVLYDYRYLDVKEEVKCSLKTALNMRRDFAKVEEEENFTIVERVLILAGIVGTMSIVYFGLCYLV